MSDNVSLDVAVACSRVRTAAAALRAEMDDMNKIWCRGGHNLAEIRAMRAVGKQARRSAR